MGNVSTRPPSAAAATPVAKRTSAWDAIVDLCSRGSAPTVLTEQEAWSIAMAWGEELRGCVRLEKDPADGDFHLVESFEWLTFVFKGCLSDGLRDVERPQETAAFARAATIAWFALSCCKGYSAEENPLFWRRVFTELLTPVYPKNEIVLIVNNPYRPQTPISDGVRLFSRCKNGFPRVMLVPKPGLERQCIDIFLGQKSIPNLPRDRQLQRILAKLKPFIDTRLWDRRMDVAIDEVPVSVLSSLASKAAEKSTSENEEAYRPHVEMALHSASVSARDLRSLKDPSRQRLMRADFDIVANPCSVEELVKERKLVDYAFASTDPSYESDKRCFRFPLVKLVEPLGSSSIETEVFCSALPHLRAFTTVQASTTQYQRMTHSRAGLSDLDWAWLGYAIFHPEAEATSTFTNLEIRLHGVEVDSIQRLAAMAHGNNLLYAVSGDDASRSATYLQAKIREAAKVRTQDNDYARVIFQFNAPSWVDVCVSTDDLSALEEYTRVVIPGVGFGWVLSADIIQVISRPAGESCLRGLRVATRSLLDEYDGLHCLLSAIGSKLTYLEVNDIRPLLPADVHEILSRCPALKSLSIPHNGTYWTATDDITDTHHPLRSHLEELELRIDRLGLESPILQPLDASYLPDLKALRIKTQSHLLDSNHPAVLSILESHESLRYFHWCGATRTRDAWWPLTHDERRARSLAFRETLTKGVHDMSRAPLAVECRLAFLSAIQFKAEQDSEDPLGRFGRDIARHIICFVPSTVAREIWITD